MKALLFLSIRSLVNAFKRALRTPSRLIGILGILAYYTLLMSNNSGGPSHDRVPQFRLPPLSAIEAFTFLGFAFISLLFLAGMFSVQLGFSQADVDVLFATPLSQRLVLAAHLLKKSFLLLLFPVIITLILWRSSGAAQLNDAGAIGLMIRPAILSMALFSVAAMSLGVGSKIWLDRLGPPAERFAKLLALLVRLSPLLVLGGGLLVAGQATRTINLLELARSPVLRVLFFMAQGATMFSFSALEPNALRAVAGLGILMGAAALSFVFALRQYRYAYDFGARSAAYWGEFMQQRTKGDFYALRAASARRKHRSARSAVARFNMRGAWAVLWKDWLLHWRVFPSVTVFFLLVAAAIGSLPWWPGIERTSVLMIQLPALGLLCWMLGLTFAQPSILNAFSRPDLIRSMPFSSYRLIFFEVLSKSIPAGLISTTLCLVAAASAPDRSAMFLILAFAAFALSFLLTSVIALVSVVFPGGGDLGQRGFTGIVMMFALGITLGPPVALFIWLYSAQRAPELPAAVSGLALALVAVGCCLLAGKLFQGYNPAE